MCDLIMDKSWKFLALLNIAMVAADLQVYPKADPFILLADFYDEEANFGVDIPKRGLNTGVVVASNEHACDPILPPPSVPNPPSHWAVLIRRYNCSFEDKVINAQNAFYDVAIVHNVDSNKLEIMNASHPELIHIMAIFISANTGREIRTKYLYDQGFVVRIEPNSGGDILGKILIPFIVVISACFILMVGFMVVKCIKDHRRSRRRRMPHSTLNKIPTTKYRKNDPYETCAICLDDFVEGEKLRVLPCSHAYHCKCIDPWLTRNRRVCPMCKRKVFAADEPMNSDGTSSEDDDHTPLLRGRNAPANNTTYSTARRVALLRAQHMREVLDALHRERDQLLQREHQERGSSSSGTSSYSSTLNEDRSEIMEQFQRAIQGLYDNDSDLDPHREDHHHHEDHHGHPGHSGEPDSHRGQDSREGSNVQVHRDSPQPSPSQEHRVSVHDTQQPPVCHTDVAHHSDSHHGDTTHGGHHEVTSHDDTTHDSHHDTTYDTHHEVSFHDDTTYDSHHDVTYDDYTTHDSSYDC